MDTARRRCRAAIAIATVVGATGMVTASGLALDRGPTTRDAGRVPPAEGRASSVPPPAARTVVPETKPLNAAAMTNPAQNIVPSPDFLDDCTATYDDSSGCVDAILQAIANARAQEGLSPMSLPSDWQSLTPSQQLYVGTNLERTARGLTPLSAMASALDEAAAAGAAQSQDPLPPAGFPWSSYGSNWAGAVGNPLEAIYYWMYDDGEGSSNIDCTPTNTSGCWGHRDNVLMALDCQPCLMGTGYDATGYDGYPSWAELLVDTSGNPQLDFSWSQVVPYLGTSWNAEYGQPDLLSDPSFEEGLGPWRVAAGQNWAFYQSPSTAVGEDYLETNAGSSPSPTLYQAIAFPPLAGHSYQASVFLRSPSSTPISVALVIWATGGQAEEVGQSQFTVSSSTWSQFATNLDVADPGHGGLIYQLYIGSTTSSLDVDGASLQDAGLSDAGFSQGLGPWTVCPGMNWAIYGSVASPVGGDYLETNSGTCDDPTLYQDVAFAPSAGHSYQASVFLRSPSSTPINVALVIWATGGPAEEVGQSQFTVSSSNWSPFYANLDVADAGHDGLIYQLYFGASGASLDVAHATLEDGVVPDAGFDQPGLGPWVVAPHANWADGNGSGAISGQTWLDTNTDGNASSWLYQDIATDPVPGHPYTESVFLKSLTGGPISVAVVLWAIGGPNPTEVGQTLATIGSTWQQVSTELDVADPGHDDLRFQIYVGTPGQTLGVDLGSLPDVAADA